MKIDFDIKKTVKEAFRAGNRARKKESVQDTVESVDKLQQQIDRFREQTGYKLEIRNGRPYYDNFIDLEYRTDLTELPDGLTVKNYLCINGCTGLTKLPDNMTVGRDFYLNDCVNLTSLPHGLTVKGSMYLKNCNGLTSFPADLTVAGFSIYRVPESLFPFFNSIGVTVRFIGGIHMIDAKDWMDRRHMVNEAFRAGNRARKKESAQDTVQSVDDIQKQINLFKEQTDIDLKIRDGHPYYGRDLNLTNCTRLTSLPTGLKVRGYLNLGGCTGLISLPAGLKVGGGLDLADCTELTRLPDDLKVGGHLFLEKCTGLTSLPAGLEVGGDLYLYGCTGLTSLSSDLVVQGGLIAHGDILTPFFRKLGIQVDKEGNTSASDWREWQKAHGYLKEAFKAGNRARKKESVHNSVSDIHDDEPVTDADVAADFLRNLNKRFPGVTRFKDDRYESTYVEFAVWDVNHQDTMWFSFWRDSANLLSHSCLDPAVTLMIWSEAVVKGSHGNMDGLAYGDVVREREAIRENYVKMLQESGLPIDMADVEARRKPRLRLTGNSLARLAAYAARQDELQHVAPAGKAFQLGEAFKAGNHARKKESAADTVKSVDAYFNSESIDELDSFIQTVWKSVCGDTGIDAPHMDNDHYDSEAGIWWGPLKFHLESGNIKYRICFLKTADMQAFNKAFNDAGNSIDEFGQECPAKWVFDMHVQIGDEMASVRLYRIEPYARYSNTNVVTYPVGVKQLTEAFSVLRLIYSRGIHTREHEAGWSTPGKQGSYFYACSRFSVQTWRNHILPIDDHEQLQKYFTDTARAVYFRECDRSVDEAFKAGNRARKKESAQNAVDALSSLELYVPDTHDTPETVLEKGSPAIESLFSRNGFGIEEKSTYLHPKEALWTVNIDGSQRKHISVAYVQRGSAGWVMFLKAGFTVIKCLDITSPEWLGFLADLTNKSDLFRLHFWMTGDGGATQGMRDLKNRYYEYNKPVCGNIVNMTEFYNVILLAAMDHYGTDMPDCCKFAETPTPVDVLRKTKIYTDIREYVSKLDVNNLGEAFRAGNRARRKESAADTVQEVDKNLKDEDIDRIIDDLCGKYPEVAHRKNYHHAFNGDVLEIYDDDADDNAILVFERPSEKDDGTVRVLVSSYRRVYAQGSEEQIGKSYKIICDRLIDDNVDSGTVTADDDGCMMFELTPGNIAAIYRYAELCNSLTEAFRAGNNARKKESAQDAAESVDGIPYPDDIGNPVKVAECLMKVAETALGRPGLAEATEIDVNFLNYENDDNIVASVDTTINGATLILIVRGFSKVRGDTPVNPSGGVCIGGIMVPKNGNPREIGPSDPSFRPGFRTSTISFWPVSDIRCWKSLIGKYEEDLKAVTATLWP